MATRKSKTPQSPTHRAEKKRADILKSAGKCFIESRKDRRPFSQRVDVTGTVPGRNRLHMGFEFEPVLLEPAVILLQAQHGLNQAGIAAGKQGRKYVALFVFMVTARLGPKELRDRGCRGAHRRCDFAGFDRGDQCTEFRDPCECAPMARIERRESAHPPCVRRHRRRTLRTDSGLHDWTSLAICRGILPRRTALFLAMDQSTCFATPHMKKAQRTMRCPDIALRVSFARAARLEPGQARSGPV